jgi:type IV pilus assembly protein PilA
MEKWIKGFTLIELCIILVIIGILSIVAIPTYLTYTKKVYFAEVIEAARPYKLAVEACYKSQGAGDAVTKCANNENGVPPIFSETGNVASVITSSEGVITATGRDKAPNDTYVLTPTPSNNTLAWTISGTCITAGTC